MWTSDPERAKDIVAAIGRIDIGHEALAAFESIASDPHTVASRETVRAVIGRAVARMPSRSPRGRAMIGQLLCEGALYARDEAAALVGLRAADEAQLFDLVWLDRCELLAPIRSRPEFQSVRKNVADRAQSILAAYERARITTRIRA